MSTSVPRLLTTALAVVVVPMLLSAGWSSSPATAEADTDPAAHFLTPLAGTTTRTVDSWPLSPEPPVERAFERPASRWGPGHRGVDLRGRLGQAVRAAAPGVVTFAGRVAGRGVVVVTHGETRTTYEPVAASVRVGERVPARGRLGRLELLGSHCLPWACLHWGLLEGERYLDPLTLVGAGPVRLLPWLGGAPEPSGLGGLVPQLPSWRPLGQAAMFRR